MLKEGRLCLGAIAERRLPLGLGTEVEVFGDQMGRRS